MGLFGTLFSKKLCTFRFTFDVNFEENFRVSIEEDGQIDENYRTWVWVLYYAKILYVLGKNPISEGLKTHLEKWAEPMAVSLAFPLQFAEEMNFLNLDGEVQIVSKPMITGQDQYLLEVFQKKDDWPYIKSAQSLGLYQNRLLYTVIVFGQYLLNKDKYFAKEMALLILSMRKYYNEKHPFTNMRSTIEAPRYAIKESMEMFNELSKELDEIEEELDDI